MGKNREYVDVKLDLLTLQPIRAPYQPKPTIMAYVKRRGLREKYGEEIAEHIDAVFKLYWCFICGRYEAGIQPTMVKGALNQYLGLSNRHYEVLSACVDEDSIKPHVSLITKRDGKQTLAIVEEILPRSIIHVAVRCSREVLDTITQNIGKIITLGGWKSRGFGKVAIARVAQVKFIDKLSPEEVIRLLTGRQE